jgi:hypothetical protein
MLGREYGKRPGDVFERLVPVLYRIFKKTNINFLN